MAGYGCLEANMVLYRRMFRAGGTYFFTVNLLERRGNDLLVRYIDVLREAVRVVKARYPFVIHAWVVLPEHTHFVIELPEGDCDYSLRIRLIKAYFSRHLPKDEMRNLARQRRHERGIWQRRFWEHLIRDERDFERHVDYVHFNPVKHGWVACVKDWPYSTFHRFVAQGILPCDWAGDDVGLALD
jgi:putative transposase